eukprot:2953233-Amphidinium_carterae.1
MCVGTVIEEQFARREERTDEPTNMRFARPVMLVRGSMNCRFLKEVYNNTRFRQLQDAKAKSTHKPKANCPQSGLIWTELPQDFTEHHNKVYTYQQTTGSLQNRAHPNQQLERSNCWKPIMQGHTT